MSSNPVVHSDNEVALGDLGPLAWVLDELRKSLDGAIKGIRRFIRDAEAAGGVTASGFDITPLRNARQQLHQSVGALDMVGLPAPTKVLRGMEALAQKMLDQPGLATEDAASRIERASFALIEYLESVLKGKNASAVALFPQYRGVMELSGAERVHPADLWAPVWQWLPVPVPAGTQPIEYSPDLRRQMDQAVLRLVRLGEASSARILLDICLGFAAAQKNADVRIFWMICAGYFEGMALQLCGDDIYTKRAASRILQQYATLGKGDSGLSDRLAQDLVFFCSRAVPTAEKPAPILSAVRAAYGLTNTKPVNYDVEQFGRFDPAVLALARKRIASAAETWSALAGGDTNRLKLAAEQFGAVAESLVKLHAESAELARALTSAIDSTLRSGAAPSPAVAMEVATSVLYLEAAYDDLDPTNNQMVERGERLAQRLEHVLSGGEPEPLEQWMEELYRRVSDRQTIGSVVDELRTSLAEVEKSLDQFFRTPTDKSALHQVPSQLAQMRGVLAVLGLEQPAIACLRMRSTVEQFLVDAVDERTAQSGIFEKIGNSLGSLSFLIDMLSYQRALAKKLFVYDEEAGEFKTLMGRERAAVVAPPAPVKPVEVAAAPTPAAPVSAPAPVVSAAPNAPPTPVARVAPAAAQPDFDDDEDEGELLDIFLEEAREVVQTGLESIGALIDNAADLEQQTVLRRAFHTLKGSSRMVGLNEFGEAAWSFEQLLNALLAEQRAASDDLLNLTGKAMHAFGRWVEDIAANKHEEWNAQDFRKSSDALRLHKEYVPLQTPGDALDTVAEIPELEEVPALLDEPQLGQAPELPVVSEPEPEAEVIADALQVPALADDLLLEVAHPQDNPATEPMAMENVDLDVLEDAQLTEEKFDFGGFDLALPESGEVVEAASVEEVALDIDLEPEVLAESLPDAELPAEVVLVAEAAMPEPASAEEIDLGDLVPLPEEPASVVVEAIELAELPEFEPEHEPEPEPEKEIEPEPEPELAAELVADIEPELAPEAEAISESALDLVPEMEPVVEETPDLESLPETIEPTEPAVETEETVELEHVEPEPAEVEVADDVVLPEPDLQLALPHEDDEGTKVIGDLRLSIPLYNIYLNEADEWSRQLQTELNEWSLELPSPLPDNVVSLAHSLSGSSSTVGFNALFTEARALEHALEHVKLHHQCKPEHANVFNNAAEDIRRLLHQFAAGFLKDADESIVAALKEITATQFPAPSLEEEQVEDLSDALATEELAAEDYEAQEEASVEPTPAAPVVIMAPPLNVVQAQDDEIDAVDNLDPDLLPIFQEEAQELMPQLGTALRQWVEHPENTKARGESLRHLHTIKGSARLAGAMRMGEMAHHLESSIEQLGSSALQSVQLEPLLTRFDALQELFNTIGQEDTALQVTPVEAQQALEADHSPAEVHQPVATVEPVAAARLDAKQFAPATMQPTRTTGQQSVRVRSQLLDRLVNQAGEVMITRSRMDVRVKQLRASMDELGGNLERLRQQLRDVELQAESQMQSRLAQTKETSQVFDPLEFDRFTRVQELTRMMAESVNDVGTVHRNLQRAIEGAEDDLISQGRQARELQRDLLRTRMVEFEAISDRLYGVVRQAGKDAGKQVKLDIVGGNIEMDRGVLDRMAPTFEHLLRNAVGHGIEAAAVRTQAGKPAAGNIVINVHQEGNDVYVAFRDDGGGLHLDKIRAKAIANGLIQEGDVLSPSEAANLIFMPGFSTADQITELSGRGIGMDVVRSEVQALGGRIETTTELGQGTTFKLILPLTTAVTQVVMLRMGQFTIGVPANLMERVLRAPFASVEEAYASNTFDVGGTPVPFYWAGALLQISARSAEAQGKTLPVAVFRSAGQRLAVHIDEVLGNREVVVKNLGPQLARMPGLAGMSVLASGAVVLIYNPVALGTVYGERVRAMAQAATAEAAQATEEGGALAAPPLPVAAARLPLVMVVDDSITVRRVTQRLLKREGYRVVLASDGLDALEKLQDELPLVVLSDIEMPRMDGFDLARNIRGDKRLHSLPIIMITSRIAEKHREHARQLGVDHYLGKPYSEDELLGLVRNYCTVPETA